MILKIFDVSNKQKKMNLGLQHSVNNEVEKKRENME